MYSIFFRGYDIIPPFCRWEKIRRRIWNVEQFCRIDYMNTCRGRGQCVTKATRYSPAYQNLCIQSRGCSADSFIAPWSWSLCWNNCNVCHLSFGHGATYQTLCLFKEALRG
ncbi:hypothetical protein ACET3Z_017863 [Daucus carota]